MGASESKLAFKEDIFRLAGEPDIAANDVWWTRFYKLPETADDVYALWSPNDLHSLLSLPDDNNGNRASHISQSNPPKNVETIIYTAIARIDLLLATSVRDDILAVHATQILNCIRILTRLLPYIYEAEHLLAWEERFFWQARKPTWTRNKKYNRRGPLFDGLDPGKEIADDADENKELGRPLGEQLLDLTTQLLFLPGFSIPKRYDASGNADPAVTYSIWQSGIGCKQSNGMTKDNERNAMEVLRLLLVLTSRMMYCSPSNVAQTDVKALTYLTTQASRQVVLSLICSLLNTVLKYNPASWRVPLDLTAITKDPKQQLVTYSLQLLLILIIYPVPQDEPNAFQKALSRLHRAEDFQFIQQGLTVVLTQPVSGMASYVPTVSKGAPFASEMLILFWELLQCNKRFRSFVVDTDRAHDFMILVLFYAMDAKDDPARQGIVRMSIFILQTLSVEPSFGQRLNKPLRGHESLPAILRIANFHGTYADYLITSIHTILTSTKGRLETIYPALLAILSNIAPFVQDIERATSSKILDLFSTFAAPQFLLANESNHTMLEASLDVINTILEHQYATNPRFIEVIVRSHGRFEALRDFTVDGALTEISRLTQERKERGADPLARSAQRSASIDSVRSPVSTRSPNLGNVPEHGAFAIGEDDDDDDDDIETEPLSRTSTPAMDSSTTLLDDVPVQSRSMSEKARGKQPVGHGSFSRATSRTVSTTSLSGAMQQPSTSYFTPSAEWLESWLPHLALHDILLVIGAERQRVRQKVANQQRQRHAVETASVQPFAEEPLVSPLLEQPGAIRLQSFTWSPMALGWYLSMLWGFIYAQDASANRGSNGLWTGTGIRLFNIQSRNEGISLRSPKGAVDAVGDSLARRISGLGFVGTTTPASPTMREI